MKKTEAIEEVCSLLRARGKLSEARIRRIGPASGSARFDIDRTESGIERIEPSGMTAKYDIICRLVDSPDPVRIALVVLDGHKFDWKRTIDIPAGLLQEFTWDVMLVWIRPPLDTMFFYSGVKLRACADALEAKWPTEKGCIEVGNAEGMLYESQYAFSADVGKLRELRKAKGVAKVAKADLAQPLLLLWER